MLKEIPDLRYLSWLNKNTEFKIEEKIFIELQYYHRTKKKDEVPFVEDFQIEPENHQKRKKGGADTLEDYLFGTQKWRPGDIPYMD